MKRIYWTWVIPSFAIGMIIGFWVGAIIQSRADAQIAELNRMAKQAEMEAVVTGFDHVLADLERFYERTTCLASWYGIPFHGRQMADGRRYDMHKNTVAHRTLPLGTVILMENMDNGKLSIGRITDRGPYISPRALDVSYAIAQELGMVEQGLATVRVMVLWMPGGRS